jgi:hypothetical protein
MEFPSFEPLPTSLFYSNPKQQKKYAVAYQKPNTKANWSEKDKTESELVV